MAAPTANVKDAEENWHYVDRIKPSKKFFKAYLNKFENCDFYQMEYKTCTSFQGKLNQYYLYGDTQDCGHWKHLHSMCKDYLLTSDIKLEERLVEHEFQRSHHRVQEARANDVWEYRTEPPDDWFKPVEHEKTHEEKDWLEKISLLPAITAARSDSMEESKQRTPGEIDDFEYLKSIAGKSSVKTNAENMQNVNNTSGQTSTASRCVIS
ncbi:uncharacterized protein LOC127841846 [Dreissena polymorpha]|uniref:Synaptic plasticity regulator PANTS n=1 Tax=Dreissena polymorpha TaxID=45954 RepID=A0A9D4ET58_DREPO|nr:uncharacterized protein LOC127841846 [Dreissena polymorpha]KAH3784933.1 hypothetical protein DPMN_163006 [Dreissena polymorpha]